MRGYAESALTDLVKAHSFGAENVTCPRIAGVHVANQPDLGIQARNDFDNLPSPFLTSIIDTNREFIRWESQRGS